MMTEMAPTATVTERLQERRGWLEEWRCGRGDAADDDGDVDCGGGADGTAGGGDDRCENGSGDDGGDEDGDEDAEGDGDVEEDGGGRR